MLARITLNQMRLHVSLGVHPWEKTAPREVILTLEVEYDASHPAKSDNVADALDYAMLEARAIGLAQAKHFELLEHLVFTLGETLSQIPRVTQLRISAEKPRCLPYTKSVSITAEFEGKS